MTVVSPGSTTRVRPRVWIGLVVLVGYLVLVVSIQHASGIPYTDIGDSGRDLFLGVGTSLIAGAIALAITTTALGWWGPALHESARSAARWPVVAPAIMAVAAGLNLLATDWSLLDAAFLGTLVPLLLVGFTEELTARGLLLTALRSRLREVLVWLVTSVLFGAMHLVNALDGQDIGTTVVQAFSAFMAGTVFYVLRRVTGSLVWAMALHSAWDVAAFTVGYGDGGALSGVAGLADAAAGIVALVAVPFVVRGVARPSGRAGR